MSKYRWVTPLTMEFMVPDYISAEETVHGRVSHIGKTAQTILVDQFKQQNQTLPVPKILVNYAEKFVSCVQKGWFSLSTPIWANFGTDRGLPISCFNSHMEDNTASITYANAEVAMMTKCGGGTSGYFGKLRGRGSPIRGGNVSTGTVHFMQWFESTSNIISQNGIRRGSFAAYLPIDHPDIEEFLQIRRPGFPVQHISFGVCVSDNFMKRMIVGEGNARKIWAAVLKSRQETGFPYIFFTDNANKGRPKVYKDKDLWINATNLCTEIMEPSTEEESFVCDLSSLNVRYYNEWKNDPEAVLILALLLDAAMTEFINKAKHVRFMERPVRFAERHRAIGVGQLGYHSFLQSEMIPFESVEAKRVNVEIAQNIQKKLLQANKEAAKMFGEPELLKGYGDRWAVTTAIAPTKSSAFILGQISESREAFHSNIVVKDTAKGKFTIFNQELEKLLEKKGKNTEEVKSSILRNFGSVQHLDFLDEREKGVFKTFLEISQLEVIQQAAQIQPYIDQGQSLNLMIHPNIPTREVNRLIIEGWESGLKSLYYQIPVSAAQTFTNNLLTCRSCEG